MHRSTIVVPSPAVATTYQFFAPSDVPATFGNAGAITLATAFFTTAACSAIAIRIYKNPSDTDTSHTVTIWDMRTRAKLREVVNSGALVAGWNEIAITPTALVSAHEYYVTSYGPTGYYTFTSGYFTANKVSGPITAYQDGTVPGAYADTTGNGCYKTGAGPLFPVSSGSGNYWVDVVVQ